MAFFNEHDLQDVLDSNSQNVNTPDDAENVIAKIKKLVDRFKVCRLGLKLALVDRCGDAYFGHDHFWKKMFFL